MIYNSQKQWPLLFLIIVIVQLGCRVSDAPRAEAMMKSSNQMKELLFGLNLYRNANEDSWPDELLQVKPYISDANFTELMINPITGDDPGYEYVKPPADADANQIPVLYQLKNGQRATDLRIGFGDGSLSEIGIQVP